MAFIRFALGTAHPDSGVDEGLFRIAYRMRNDSAVAEGDRQTLAQILEWFERNLSTPKRFNRSKSKGFDRRRTRGIAWFRDTADECISRMHRLKNILETYGHPVAIIGETRIGYIVYENDLQVVAEPFSDTQTSG